MAGTLVKRVLLQISADDADAEAKIEAISLKADELRDKHPELKIRIDTAEAQAKMAVLRGELKELSVKADEEAAKGGILSRFLGGGNGKSFLSGFGSIFSHIPGLGGAGGDLGGGQGATGGAGLLGSGAGGAVAIGVIVDALAAASTEITGIVSGFAAAGAGAGAFYLLAHPAINNLMADIKGLDAANQAQGIAQQKYLIDPTKANAAALAKANLTYKATYQQMGQDAGGAAAGVLKLHDTYVKLSNAFQPEAFKVFNGFLQLANQLLPTVVPFANTFADAISGLLKDASKFAGSSGFKDWLAQFQKLEGPSITAIGTGVGHLVTSFGKLLTVMSAKDVVNALNIAFSVLDGTIIGFTRFVQASMFVWDQFTSQWDQGAGQIRTGGHVIAAAFDAVRHAAADMGHGVAIWFDRERHDVASFAAAIGHYLGDVVTFFRRLPGEIGGALAALPGMLFAAGANAIRGLLNGAQSMIGGLLSTVAGWGHDLANAIGAPFGIHFSEPSQATQMVKAGRNIALGLGAGIEQGTASAHASAARMSRSVTGGIAGQPGAAAGGGAARLQLEWVGGSADQALITLLKQHIRIRGGNPSVLGA